MTHLRKLIYFTVFAIGLFFSISWFIQSGLKKSNSDIYYQINKFQTVITVAQQYYIDDIDWGKVFEAAIGKLLQELDPHSVYISQEATKRTNEEFSGHYYGIGVEYDLIDEYIRIIQVLPNSPSEKSGLQNNDIIVKIDGESAYGIKRSDVPKKLKGPKGSKVIVSVERHGYKELLDIEILRDEIPTFSVPTFFMYDDKTGYIRLRQFVKTSADEIEEALVELKKQGMKQLIFDLRDNPGGLLDQAVKITSKFLTGHKKIVYTIGKVNSLNEEFFADTFEADRKVRNVPLIILINRASASASEIVSGALQDHDRALVVGERSFGKGLVQRPWELKDGSSFRLTISKYYTPTGRLIQRDYKGKNLEEYYREIYEDSTRYKKGMEADSTKEFKTLNLSRSVYGGGGIFPDVLIQEKYQKYQNVKLMNRIRNERIYFEFVQKINAEIRQKYKSKTNFMKHFEVNSDEIKLFKKIAAKKNIILDDKNLEENKYFIHLLIKANLAKDIFGNKAYYEVFARKNPLLKEVPQYFDQAKKMQFN
jgi:carboxyl-terminal processing protease